MKLFQHCVFVCSSENCLIETRSQINAKWTHRMIGKLKFVKNCESGDVRITGFDDVKGRFCIDHLVPGHNFWKESGSQVFSWVAVDYLDSEPWPEKKKLEQQVIIFKATFKHTNENFKTHFRHFNMIQKKDVSDERFAIDHELKHAKSP